MDEHHQSEQEPVETLASVTQNDSSVLNSVSTAVPPLGSDGSITWTASEFIAHQKSLNWYVMVVGSTILMAAIVWLLTKDVISTITIIVAAVILVLASNKKPRTLEYQIDNEGLHVAYKVFPFDQFRSFAIVHQGAFSSLVFMPLKRFSLLIVAYYDPADEKKIIDLLAARIPLEEKKLDLIEELMWKIRY